MLVYFCKDIPVNLAHLPFGLACHGRTRHALSALPKRPPSTLLRHSQRECLEQAAADNRQLSWCILTNGYEWISYANSDSFVYFIINITVIIEYIV